MSQRVETTLLDDLDLGKGKETPAERTLPFAVDGVDYEIDVSRKHEERFLEAVGPFIKAARRPPRAGRRASQPARPRSGRRHTADIRQWAKDRGLDLKDRGRIPALIEDQYNREHGLG